MEPLTVFTIVVAVVVWVYVAYAIGKLWITSYDEQEKEMV